MGGGRWRPILLAALLGLAATPGPAEARAGAEPGLLVVPLEAPPPGVYTVAWRALSAVDGHVTAGAFAFALGADQVPPEGLRPAALGAGARWLTYLSLALLVAPLFRFSAPLPLGAASSGEAEGRARAATMGGA